jgi:hypothetical protein
MTPLRKICPNDELSRIGPAKWRSADSTTVRHLDALLRDFVDDHRALFGFFSDKPPAEGLVQGRLALVYGPSTASMNGCLLLACSGAAAA